MQKSKSNTRLVEQSRVTALAFSPSGQFCSVGIKNDVKLLIFRVKDISNFDSWELLQEFTDQFQPISEVDWSKDDKLISGSHDRSVFVYKKGDKLWQKMLVNIDIKLSILCTKWAPSGKKFAIGSSCNTVGVGFYNNEANCWTISTRDKHWTSPITSVSFHPSSNILAVGSTDNSIKIITTSFKNSKNDFTNKSDIEDKNYQGPFANVDSLFEVLYSIENVGAWVNHVSFELNGNFLLALPHSNHFKIFEIIESDGKIAAKQQDIKWNGLPFLSGYISDKGILYAGGFDKKVAVFNRSAQGFTFANYLDTNEKSSKQRATRGLVSSKLSQLQKRGTTINTSSMPTHDQHMNSIKVLPSPGKKFVVSYDVNGVIHFWS